MSMNSLLKFYDYYMSFEIDTEHLVPHMRTKSGLAESFIKCLRVIVRILLLYIQLPTSK